MIIIDPRRTSSVTVAEAVAPDRVLHLRPNLGTDYVLANAIARAVLEKGWWDKEFVEKRTDLKTFLEGTHSAKVVAELFCFRDILVSHCQILLARLYLIQKEE